MLRSWTVMLLLSAYLKGVNSQSSGLIVRQPEEVVVSSGAAGVLNCTVSTTDRDVQEQASVEWVFLNATGGAPKTISSDCSIKEEHNTIEGKEKYVIGCFELTSSNILYSLTVNLATFHDSGWYECRVRLPNEQLPVDTMRVKLTVLSPPKIKTAASCVSIDVLLGGTVIFPCISQGNPGPNVTWSRANGAPLPSKRAVQSRVQLSDTETSQNLIIYNVSRTDTGYYRCSADNNIQPPDEFLSRLSVQYKPIVTVFEPTYGSDTGENTRVMIWCRVQGHPRPDLTWYGMTTEDGERYERGDLEFDDTFFANAQVIRTDSKYSIEQKIMNVGRLSTIDALFTSLDITTVEPGDMIYYVCSATNNRGRDQAVVSLDRINTFAGGRQ
ncbi:opioid-binding protein/cell adhesion molecule homolog isoform X1 [Watersipora subatra]|uniref:opioid-binding protein/cell adhesion molecule homolog isoform X1 n=1 Tax=Watersipora subatra TaxID=2589382 RepID=UPI00355B6DA6